MNTLTPRSREVLIAIMEIWDQENLLPGRMSYNDVFRMCDELGIDRPSNLTNICDMIEKRDFS